MAASQNEPDYPGFLQNHSDQQSHTLNDRPTFYIGGMERFTSWQDFMAAHPPPPDHHPDRMMAVCEDGNPWPLSFEIVPDLQDRAMQYSEFENQAEQGAYAGSVKETYTESMLRVWSIACLMVFSIVSVFTLLLVMQSDTAKGIWGGFF